jgi:hypothetical protein
MFAYIGMRVTEFMHLQCFTVDFGAALGSFDVGSVADVSKAHAASIFMVALVRK